MAEPSPLADIAARVAALSPPERLRRAAELLERKQSLPLILGILDFTVAQLKGEIP